MTTRHNCGGPVFGRKTVGCPRCDELLAGAAPVVWKSFETAEQRRYAFSEQLRAHFDSDAHRSGKCGPVCTFGDW